MHDAQNFGFALQSVGFKASDDIGCVVGPSIEVTQYVPVCWQDEFNLVLGTGGDQCIE